MHRDARLEHVFDVHRLELVADGVLLFHHRHAGAAPGQDPTEVAALGAIFAVGLVPSALLHRPPRLHRGVGRDSPRDSANGGLWGLLGESGRDCQGAVLGDLRDLRPHAQRRLHGAGRAAEPDAACPESRPLRRPLRLHLRSILLGVLPPQQLLALRLPGLSLRQRRDSIHPPPFGVASILPRGAQVSHGAQTRRRKGEKFVNLMCL
mmetsp:Transcript_67276/g.160527  ORF Transcript_67276/g.160527 Transcript_67276/m.160527 type:complete len:207 (+) Transcript_67276:271-891(+)